MSSVIDDKAFSALDLRQADLRAAAANWLEALAGRNEAAIKVATALVKERLQLLDATAERRLPARYQAGRKRGMLPQEELREDIRDLLESIEGGNVEGVILGMDRVRDGLENFKPMAPDAEDEIALKVVVVLDCKVKKGFGIDGLIENAPTYIDYALGQHTERPDSPYRLGNSTVYVDINDFEKDRAEALGPFDPAEAAEWIEAPQSLAGEPTTL